MGGWGKKVMEGEVVSGARKATVETQSGISLLCLLLLAWPEVFLVACRLAPARQACLVFGHADVQRTCGSCETCVCALDFDGGELGTRVYLFACHAYLCLCRQQYKKTLLRLLPPHGLLVSSTLRLPALRRSLQA